MKLNWKEIYEGWRNKLIPPAHLKEQIKKVAEERSNICKKCEFVSSNMIKYSNYRTMRIDEHCTKCGCPIASKTTCLSCRCPLPKPKWIEVISRQEEDEIRSEKDFSEDIN